MTIKEKRHRFIILLVNIFLLLFGILIRDNSFTATPALLILVLYSYDAKFFQNKPKWSKIVLAIGSLLLAFFIMKGLNGFFLSGHMGNRDYKKSYLINQLCKYDLLGMSVLKNHKGITSVLSKKERYQIERLYNILPIYWLIKTDRRLFGKDQDIFKKWKRTVINDPLLYMRHRFHIFIKTFGGRSVNHLMWINQAHAGIFKNNMIRHTKIPTDKFDTPGWHKNNAVFMAIKAYLKWYFNLLGSAFPYAFMGILMLLHGIHLLYFKKQNIPVVKIIYLVNLTAFLYYIPYLFFVHQAETRYVYPSIVLIILTVPFFIAYCIYKSNRKENNSDRYDTPFIPSNET